MAIPDVFCGMPVFFINLDSRTDRDKEVRTEFPTTNLTRVAATANADKPWIGCLDSHHRAVQMGVKTKAPYFAVIEDDAMMNKAAWTRSELQASVQALLDMPPYSWDACLMVLYGETEAVEDYPPGIRRLVHGQCAAAYIVPARYAPVVECCFARGMGHALKTDDDSRYSSDQVWKVLQKRDSWVAFDFPVAMLIRPSVSDIDPRFLDTVKDCNGDYNTEWPAAP